MGEHAKNDNQRNKMLFHIYIPYDIRTHDKEISMMVKQSYEKGDSPHTIG